MNYTQLKANIENFLEDDSAELTTSIDQIIAQAEEMIFQRLPNLPCFRNTSALGTSDGQSDYTISDARNDQTGINIRRIWIFLSRP